MKLILAVTVIFVSAVGFAQGSVNLKKGYAAQGYDVVAYFANEAIEGNKLLSTTYKGVKYKFSTRENLNTFTEDPEMYIPQYGGFCAYAVAEKSEKVGVNPKTFQIIDNKLYLFYNSWGVNTLEKWNEEGAEALLEKADVNWKNIVKKGS
jgi:YHS domain-containing protein